MKIGTKADLTQRWYWPYSGCSLNPSISAGFPWAVQVTATPICSNSGKAAVRKSSPTSSPATNYFAQANTGSPASFSGWRDQVLCLGYTATVHVYKGSISDSFTIGSSSTRVCAYAPSY